MSEKPPTNDPLDEAFAVYLRSCDEGNLHSREEFLEQFPDLADELKQLLEAADILDQFSSRATQSSDASADQAGVETIAWDHEPSKPEADAAVTLPLAHRAQGDPGPTLPYDLDGLYLLLEEIGHGGMGVVYLAKQHDLDRHVAVKMIRSGVLAGSKEVKRFYVEAQATARLHHPGIVGIHHFGRFQGHHYFSMEHILGTDLQKKINAEILNPSVAARYVRDMARAIHHAHQRGVLHRDLKPANVLIDQNDEVHITDFGLAKHMDEDGGLTGSGAAVGTPHYMAPEQAGGDSDCATRRSDVYSLGAILFACLTGRPPIVADTVMQTLVQVVHHPAPALRTIRDDVPIDLETIVAKCLEKDPQKRYATAEDLADDLDAFLEGQPIQARPQSRVMKVWRWIEEIPVIAALTGRKLLHTSSTHRRFQAAMLLLLLMTPIVAASLFTLWQMNKESMPHFVRIAGGIEDGVYTEISRELAERLKESHAVEVDVMATGGSLDNRDRLLGGLIDLAPMQATAISGDRIRVVAPLFYEVLFVLARTDTNIQVIDDLAGQLVAVGPEGSGSQATAALVFQSLGLSESVRPQTGDWQHLFGDSPPAAATVCIGAESPLIRRLLTSGRWRIIGIPTGMHVSLQHPNLRFMTIEPEDVPDSLGIAASIPTVGTTAFLAARDDSPSELVIASLEALYREPTPLPRMIPRKHAAEWQGLAFHPAARRYYAQSE